MTNSLDHLLPCLPNEGPPLPRFLGLTWGKTLSTAKPGMSAKVVSSSQPTAKPGMSAKVVPSSQPTAKPGMSAKVVSSSQQIASQIRGLQQEFEAVQVAELAADTRRRQKVAAKDEDQFIAELLATGGVGRTDYIL